MFISIPPTKVWHEHLAERFREAIDSKIIADHLTMDLSNAFYFAPKGVSLEDIKGSRPDSSLRELLNMRPEHGRWIEREDLYPEAAQWMHDFSLNKNLSLVCIAGFLEADEMPSGGGHFLYNGHVLSKLNLQEVGAPELTVILRKSFSWQLIGAIVDTFNGEQFEPISEGYFICDCLDKDSLAVIPLGA